MTSCVCLSGSDGGGGEIIGLECRMILLYFNAFIMTISAPLRSHKRKNAKLTGRFLRFAPVTKAPLKYSKKGAEAE